MITNNNSNKIDAGSGETIAIPSFLTNFKLPAKSLEERKTTIGGSEICVLASDNEERQKQLYDIKTGVIQPDDLTTVWAVIMGWVTEEANLSFFEFKNQLEVINKQKVLTSDKYKFMRCTLDGSIKNYKNRQAVIDAKFTLGFKRIDEEYADVIPRLIKYYSPQLHWNAYLLEENTGRPVPYGILSICRGGNEPTIHEVKIDKEYQHKLIQVAKTFMYCVNHNLPYNMPEYFEPPTPAEDKVPVDMANTKAKLNWKRHSETWLQTYGAKQSCLEAEKALKNLVPKNASTAFGNGIKISVSKNNRKKIEVLDD
tara:strand:+ start:2625 stop:3560 length:936 start_codon:yes stop_codon:yes gene_type:complete